MNINSRKTDPSRANVIIEMCRKDRVLIGLRYEQPEELPSNISRLHQGARPPDPSRVNISFQGNIPRWHVSITSIRHHNTLNHFRRTPRRLPGTREPQLSTRLVAAKTPSEVSKKTPSLGIHTTGQDRSVGHLTRKVTRHLPRDTTSGGHLRPRRMKYNLTLFVTLHSLSRHL